MSTQIGNFVRLANQNCGTPFPNRKISAIGVCQIGTSAHHYAITIIVARGFGAQTSEVLEGAQAYEASLLCRPVQATKDKKYSVQ